jgi:hypothetical protein
MHFKKVLVIFIAFALAFAVFPADGSAELRAMNDDEMTEIYATGFSSFEILSDGTIDTARAWFNIQAYTFTEIDSLKLGYHNNYNYKDPTPGFGWDEDWVGVQIGGDLNNPAEDFYAEGFYFEADFTDIDDPSIRELKSVRFGFDYVQGPISADFINFSGTINDGAGAPEYNGHLLNLGPVTITADPGGTDGTGGFEISLNIDTYDKGYWVTFDNAVVTP